MYDLDKLVDQLSDAILETAFNKACAKLKAAYAIQGQPKAKKVKAAAKAAPRDAKKPAGKEKEAETVKRLHAAGKNWEEIAKIVNRSRGYVYKHYYKAPAANNNFKFKSVRLEETK